MKKICTLLIVFTMFLSVTGIASAVGFRTSIQHNTTSLNKRTKIVGGQANFKIPRDSNINDVYEDYDNRIHPEFFIKLETRDGAGYDGGVLKYDGKWYPFLYGTNNVFLDGIDEGRSLNIAGDTIQIKFVGEYVGGKYYTVLYIDGVEQYRIGRDEYGWAAENAGYAGVKIVGYELNMVPGSAISSKRYHSVGDRQGRAYFDGAEITGAQPVKANGRTVSSGFSWYEQTDCDDPQYSQREVNKVTNTVVNTTYLWSTLNFDLLK